MRAVCVVANASGQCRTSLHSTSLSVVEHRHHVINTLHTSTKKSRGRGTEKDRGPCEKDEGQGGSKTREGEAVHGRPGEETKGRGPEKKPKGEGKETKHRKPRKENRGKRGGRTGWMTKVEDKEEEQREDEAEKKRETNGMNPTGNTMEEGSSEKILR